MPPPTHIAPWKYKCLACNQRLPPDHQKHTNDEIGRNWVESIERRRRQADGLRHVAGLHRDPPVFAVGTFVLEQGINDVEDDTDPLLTQPLVKFQVASASVPIKEEDEVGPL